ncbi:MAG: ferrous iron transport protein A [Anaerolineae bacterium]|nr:ferrous iron transport protein A [Anaerolineae bacterium]
MCDRHLMPLSMAAPGDTVELVEIRGGRRFRQRLADLGLNTGTSVRVIQNDHTGPLILAVKHDARLALGQGAAHRIQILPIHHTSKQDEPPGRGIQHEQFNHCARRQSQCRQKHHL